MITAKQARVATRLAKIRAANLRPYASKPKEILTDVIEWAECAGLPIIDVEIKSHPPFPRYEGDFNRGIRRTEAPTLHVLTMSWESYQ